MNYIFRLAGQGDEMLIYQLYRSNIGIKGCTWGNEYPSLENVREDISDKSLYCLEDESLRLVAAAAAGEFNELGSLNCWDKSITRPCELARIGVIPSEHNMGIGTIILKNVINACKARGFNGMQFLVSDGNEGALALYKKMGFNCCGKVFMYGHNYFCYQKLF